MPSRSSRRASGVPSSVFWRIVSSCRMTPLMNAAIPFVVRSIWR